MLNYDRAEYRRGLQPSDRANSSLKGWPTICRHTDLERRLQQAEAALVRLNRNGKTLAGELLTAAQTILERRQVVGLLAIAVTETVTAEVRLLGRGRPGGNRPTQVVQRCTTQLAVSRQANAIAQAQQLYSDQNGNRSFRQPIFREGVRSNRVNELIRDPFPED